MTMEVRMSSRAHGCAQGHYMMHGECDTVASLLKDRARYMADFPSCKKGDVVFEPWKDWELLMNQPGKPYTSTKAIKVAPNVTRLVNEVTTSGHCPGYYGKERHCIDVDSMPPGTKLRDVFDFLEHFLSGARAMHGRFEIAGNVIRWRE